MPTSTVENYLKQIYLAGQGLTDEELVSMGSVAEGVGVTPGTATSMVKSLAEGELLDYAPRGGVRLTDTGERMARQVLRRHRLIEQFLVEIIGLDWSEVHEEAEVLEHAVSEKLLDRIDALLGHPSVDPHGDPIPPADDEKRRSTKPTRVWTLADCPMNESLQVSRVIDQTPPFLQFLDRHGLVPGALVTVTGRESAADSTAVETADHGVISLGTTAATKVLVAA
ncbi:MAG: metal-dependent transcriptional regulator, partial [Planctomycetota bacterium]